MKLRAWLLAIAIMTASGVSIADELSGEVSLGYRGVTINGDRSKYNEDVNLDDGPRLFRAALTWLSESPEGNAPDLVDIELSGFGGDPFESASFEARKYGRWRFTAQRRRSDYAYDDILVLPENASIDGSTGGDYHRYDFERLRDDVSLAASLSERASATIGFERYGRRGDSTTTLGIQRDEFELEKPIEEEMRLLRGNFRYRWDRLALSLEERLRNFESNSTIFLAGSAAGENPDNLSTLDSFFLNQPYEYSGHEHIVRVDAWPDDRLELRVAAMLGKLDMTTSASESSQGTDFSGMPYITDESGAVSADRDTSLLDLDLSYTLGDRFAVTAGAARREFGQVASGGFGSEGDRSSDWDIATTSVDAGLQFAASRDLTVSAGWYGDRRDVALSVTSVTGTAELPGEKTSTGGYFAKVDYRAGDRLSLRASVNGSDTDDPFTLAFATDLRRYRFRARYAFDNGLSITASHSRTDSTNAPSSWSSDVRQTSLRLTYTSERWVLSAGVSDYDGRRQVKQSVTGGTRRDLFAYTWIAQTSNADASLVFKANERWTFGGAFRRYDNEGSIDVSRTELSGFAEVLLPKNYALRLNIRDIDFGEDNIESYDARIVEAALRLAFR